MSGEEKDSRPQGEIKTLAAPPKQSPGAAVAGFYRPV